MDLGLLVRHGVDLATVEQRVEMTVFLYFTYCFWAFCPWPFYEEHVLWKTWPEILFTLSISGTCAQQKSQVLLYSQNGNSMWALRDQVILPQVASLAAYQLCLCTSMASWAGAGRVRRREHSRCLFLCLSLPSLRLQGAEVAVHELGNPPATSSVI